jgi:hypothetical protein
MASSRVQERTLQLQASVRSYWLVVAKEVQETLQELRHQAPTLLDYPSLARQVLPPK